MTDPLSKLIRRADAVSESASVLVSRAIREIRGEIANLSGELNLAGNADDRDRAYAMIRRRMNRLGRNLNRLLSAQNQEAAKGAAKAASDMTGLEIKYSAQRAKAICELVTPAQGENLAAVFTERMGANMIRTLREATVSALRQQAIAGGSVKDLSRDMSDRWSEALKGLAPVFTDAGGHAWNTAAYFQMNVRTNTMRVYNDCLVDDVARETGSDLMRISKGGDPNCPLCFPWEGCIISVTGKTRGFPTYDDARKAGCFHPNCTHTLEYVDESADADEIALHKDHPVTGDPADADAQDERRYEIDQARKMRDEGMTAQEARVAVDRDNLASSIRHGLVRSDAEKIVSQMTDAQVTRLCPNGNPPAFTPVKRIAGGTRKEPKYENERWNHGKRGGVVHIKRDADLAHILSVTKADAPHTNDKAPVAAKKKKTVQSVDGNDEKQYKADLDALVNVTDTTPRFYVTRSGTRIEYGMTNELVRAAFDGIDSKVMHTYSAKVSAIVGTKAGSYCDGSGTRIHMGPNDWSRNKETFLHESGHAVLNARQNECIKNADESGLAYITRFPDKSKGERGSDWNMRSFLTDYGKRIFDTLLSDAETFFDGVSGAKMKAWRRGKEVETDKRNWGSLTDEMITKRLFGVEKAFSDLTMDEKHVYGAVADTIQAVTKNAYHGNVGHDESYYSDATSGIEMRFHEPFANISAMLAMRSNPACANAIGIFGNYAKIIAKDYYGIDL